MIASEARLSIPMAEESCAMAAWATVAWFRELLFQGLHRCGIFGDVSSTVTRSKNIIDNGMVDGKLGQRFLLKYTEYRHVPFYHRLD